MASQQTAKHYDSRAQTYDTKTTFHSTLASKYAQWVLPQLGESLLDLACGTGLVTFAFLPFLCPPPSPANPGLPGQRIIGVDISSGMLDVAREKLDRVDGDKPKILFVEHDITTLEDVEELQGTEGSFDIITLCSAFVLLSNPASALQSWAKFLKKGGRLIVDVPSTKSMLGLKILDEIKGKFGVSMLGERTWIKGVESLKELLDVSGFDAKVFETEEFGDIPAKTGVKGSKVEDGVWGLDEGGVVFDGLIGGFEGWKALGEEERNRARSAFEERWKLEGDEEGLVREVGSLYVGIGKKR